MSAEEAASLPPLTDQEADAFERVIEEACEQIEGPRTAAVNLAPDGPARAS